MIGRRNGREEGSERKQRGKEKSVRWRNGEGGEKEREIELTGIQRKV